MLAPAPSACPPERVIAMPHDDVARVLAEDFAQLTFRFTDPTQFAYEVIRPVVLFAETVAARSAQTGLDRATVGEKARRFVQHGMVGLVDHRTTASGRTPHRFPDPVASYILSLKHIYPSIRYREIVRILKRKFGYHTNHHTVKRFLDDHPIPVQLPLAWTTFHQFEDAYRARWTVVRMYHEGWHPASIAGCLHLSRQHVWNIITAFAQDGFAGLEDQRTRPPDHPANQLTLPFLKEVLDLQHAHPRVGRVRLHGLLDQQYQAAGHADALPSERTVGRAMTLNRAVHGAPGPWPPSAADTEIAPEVHAALPYPPVHRHGYWFIDLRYLRKFDDSWTYSICVLEGYSRKILAGMASMYQDEIAVLQILTAAVSAYGCPTAIVSDNGAVFTAHAYCGMLETLGIEPCYIEKGKPWQNLIEAQFKVQSRLGDPAFEAALTFEDLQAQHAAFIETFNTTAHWAHRHRADGLRTPADVLAWVRGRRVAPEELHTVLREMQVERTVDRRGYVRLQRFYVYAERGLARQRVAIWLYEGQVQIAYHEALLARYTAKHDRKRKRLRSISHPVLYHTAYASPQLEFWELDDAQWRKVLERPIPSRQQRQSLLPPGEQLPLPWVSLVVILVLLKQAV
jgi:transposase InsO family protein